MITIENQRILWLDNGVLRDLSLELNDFRGQVITFDYEPGDYLYIGTFFPFNHRYFDVFEANLIQAEPTIEYWDGTQWIAAVDILDESNDLAKSGVIRFVPDDDKQSWTPDDESNEVDGLAGTNIYDKYWLRLSWSQAFTPTTQLNYIGFCFSDDDQLYGRYPDLNNQQFKNNFEPTQPSGTKIDWVEQHFIAADEIIRDLKRKLVVKSANQILDYALLSDASIHKVAEIVYASLGEAYENNRKLCREYYNIALNQGIQPVDVNMNARSDVQEQVNLSGKMTR